MNKLLYLQMHHNLYFQKHKSNTSVSFENILAIKKDIKDLRDKKFQTIL